MIALLLWLGAMAAYPGWSAFDADAESFDVRRNFVCDLLSAQTPGGRANGTGSLLMSSAVLLLLFGGLVPLWRRIPATAAWRGLASVLGALACLLTVAVVVEQAFGLPWPHGAITLSAGFVGLVPTAIAAAADWRSPRSVPWRRLLSVGMLAAATVNFGGYMWAQLGGPLHTIVPIAQSAALLMLMVWLTLEPLGRSAPRN